MSQISKQIIQKYIKELKSEIHYAPPIMEGNIAHIQEHSDIQEEEKEEIMYLQDEFNTDEISSVDGNENTHYISKLENKEFNEQSAVDQQMLKKDCNVIDTTKHQQPLLQGQPQELVERKINKNQILYVDIAGNNIIEVDDKNVLDNSKVKLQLPNLNEGEAMAIFVENYADLPSNQLPNPDCSINDPLQNLNRLIKSVNPFLNPLKGRPKKKNILLPLFGATERTDEHNPCINYANHQQPTETDLNKNNTNVLSLESVDGEQQIQSESLKMDTIKSEVNEISVIQRTTNSNAEDNCEENITYMNNTISLQYSTAEEDAVHEILTASQEIAVTNLVSTEKQTHMNEVDSSQYSTFEEAEDDHEIVTKSIQIESQETTGEILAPDVISDVGSLQYSHIEEEEKITSGNLISEEHQIDRNDDKSQCSNSEDETDQDRLILMGLSERTGKYFTVEESPADINDLDTESQETTQTQIELEKLSAKKLYSKTNQTDKNDANSSSCLNLEEETDQHLEFQLESENSFAKEDDQNLGIKTESLEIKNKNITGKDNQTDNYAVNLQYSNSKKDIDEKFCIQIEPHKMALLRSEENQISINDANEIQHQLLEPIGESLEECVYQVSSVQNEVVNKNEIELQEIVDKNYRYQQDQNVEVDADTQLKIQKDSINMEKKESGLQDIKNEISTNDNQTKSPQYSNPEEDDQKISNKSQKVMDKNLTDEKNQTHMSDVDSSQYSKMEERLNQSPTKYVNVDKIEHQLQEITVENLVVCVDQVPGSQPEFELHEIIDEHLDNELQEIKSAILSSTENQADMNDENSSEYLYEEEDQNYRIVPKSQKILSEKLVTEADLIGTIDADTSQVANVQEEAYQDHGIEQQLREIMSENLEELSNEVSRVQTKSVNINKIVLELEKIMSDHSDNRPVNINDADSLKFSINKKDGVHDVNKEHKVQTETNQIPDPYGGRPKPEPKVDHIELQLKEIIGDQSDENLKTNSEMNLLQCLLEDEVYKIQSSEDNTCNIEDDQDDPDDSDYVDSPAEEKVINIHSYF